jgi:hypothetical protein
VLVWVSRLWTIRDKVIGTLGGMSWVVAGLGTIMVRAVNIPSSAMGSGTPVGQAETGEVEPVVRQIDERVEQRATDARLDPVRMGGDHVDLAGVAVAGLIWVGDQLAEADHAILGLGHQLVDPARGGEPLAGLLERGERHPHDPLRTCGLVRISWTAS